MPDGRIHPLVRLAVERRVTMTMILVGIFVLGWLALDRLPLEFLPRISSSNVSVQAPYPSSSPEETARRIVHPLEDSLGTLNGLEQMTSQATGSSGEINLTFVDGTDMDLATVEVRDRVDRVRHLLPPDLRRIRIRRFQTSDIPVLRFHLSSEGEAEKLYDFAERVVQRRLERLDGVAQTTLRGLLIKEVQIRLDPDRLDAHGIDIRELVARLRQNHLNLSAGHIVEGGRKLLVRCEGELSSLEEIRRLPINAAGLRLEDVAEVAYAFPRQDSFNFLNGVEALTVSVYKESSANLLAVVDRANAELEKIASEPASAGFSTRVYHDSSIDVREGLSQLRNAGFLGGGLAILAVFLFLRRVRTTLLVGIAIPVSVIFTFVLLYLFRQAGWSTLTLNVVSLMGLVLALGMLVDNSIVVIESIYRHLEELGEDAVTAAKRGASDVALPILASTATTLCVFIPVIFLRGGGSFFSRYLVEIGTTVCLVMVASLLVALTVVPMAAALLLGRERPRESPALARLGSLYESVLRLTLRHRLAFVLLGVALLWGSWALFGSIERTFAQSTRARQVTIHVDTPRNYSLEQTRALFKEVAAILDAHRDRLEIADISYSFFRGNGRARGRSRQRRFDVFLVGESESRRSTTEILEGLRELLPVRAGIDFSLAQSQRGPRGQAVEVEISGDDPEILELVGREVADLFADLPRVRDVDLSLESGDDEIHVQVQRERAVRAGLSSRAVAFSVQNSLSDRALAQLKTEEREIDLVMQYRERDRETLGQLKNVTVHTAGTPLPLDALADFAVVPGPRSVERENRRPKITISTSASNPRAVRMAMMGVEGVMRSLTLPPGYTWTFGRRSRRGQQDEAGADFALLFALVLVYMLMAALFESFTHPFAIMISIPFAFIGVGVVMKLAGQPRDNFTELGFLILIGVVVNNAIVLVDHINRLRREGLERDAAILLGGRHRLRAILMTAVTTILGLLPMVAPILLPSVFGPLEGRAATWAPVALVILGGLTTSTVLTLMMVPTAYSLIGDISSFFRRVNRAV